MNLLTSGYMFGAGRGGFISFDWTYVLAILGFILTLAAQGMVSSTFKKYSVRTVSGLSGAEGAQRVLEAFGIGNVGIEGVSGQLTDHYDPQRKTLRLSEATYGVRTVAAVCVAAHECGHAKQDKDHFGPLVLRSVLVPTASFGSQAAWPVFLAGLIFSIRPLLTVGIVLFCLAVLFQLVTLPVEFDASRRALKVLSENHILPPDEMEGAKKVLTAAAMTYVAALASSLLQLLRLIILARGNNRD